MTTDTALVAVVGSRTLQSGNEAVARGAVEAGVRVAVGYPGTPGTEILESIANRTDVDTEALRSALVARVPHRHCEMNLEALSAEIELADGRAA